MSEIAVIMSVYRADRLDYLKEALESLYWQMPRPDIYVQQDGQVEDSVAAYLLKAEECGQIAYLGKRDTNKGLAISLNELLKKVLARPYTYIVRMDADDISRSYRFQKQLEAFKNNPMLSVVGGQITEIQHDTKKEIGKRVVPQTDAEIKHYIKSRCPFNQMTVMFKKDAVLEAGNYQDFFHNEDYYLWIRMYLKGFSFYNLEDVLVDVRVNEEFYARRGGWRYFMSEYKIQHIMYKNGIISLPKYLFNVTIRFVLQVVLSDGMRGYVFKTLARKRN